MKKSLILILAAVFITLFCTSCKSSDYKAAVDLLRSGEINSAYSAFSELGDYKESKEVVFYLAERSYISKNNQLDASARELVDTLNAVGIFAALSDSSVTITVSSKDAISEQVNIIINASVTIVTEAESLPGSESYFHTINCKQYELDVDTCAKIIVMNLDELIDYINHK